MSRKIELNIGKAYTNDEMWMVREIVDMFEDTVWYRAYHLSTGAMCDGIHKCDRLEFLQWADRESSVAEIDSLLRPIPQSIDEANEIYNQTQHKEHDLAVELFQHATRVRMINR